MRIRETLKSGGLRIALVVLVLAAALAAKSLVDAVRVESVPDVPPPTLASAGAIGGVSVLPAADIRAAVDKDPFSPDRVAPASAYRLPGEPDPRKAVTAVEPEKPVVLGTAVSGDGKSFAIVKLAAMPQGISLAVGDKIGGYTVKSIERGHVVFITAAGKQLDLTALKP